LFCSWSCALEKRNRLPHVSRGEVRIPHRHLDPLVPEKHCQSKGQRDARGQPPRDRAQPRRLTDSPECQAQRHERPRGERSHGRRAIWRPPSAAVATGSRPAERGDRLLVPDFRGRTHAKGRQSFGLRRETERVMKYVLRFWLCEKCGTSTKTAIARDGTVKCEPCGDLKRLPSLKITGDVSRGTPPQFRGQRATT
jgi:hypothetical protein